MTTTRTDAEATEAYCSRCCRAVLPDARNRCRTCNGATSALPDDWRSESAASSGKAPSPSTGSLPPVYKDGGERVSAGEQQA